jgi:hypothetical protein
MGAAQRLLRMSKGLSGLRRLWDRMGDRGLSGKEICKRRLWKGAPLYRGPVREHGGRLHYRGLRKVNFHFY